VRAQPGRTKKLIVAFHFHPTNQAGWKCDDCRRDGLEKKRRCGFLPEGEVGPERVVWARGRVSTTACPKSYITSDSLNWLENYFAWKLFRIHEEPPPARTVDAYCVLEDEVRKELSHGD
jgi:hypothetical protein